jgi:hypothetical protein
MSRKNRTNDDGTVRPRLGQKPHKRPGKAARKARKERAKGSPIPRDDGYAAEV